MVSAILSLAYVLVFAVGAVAAAAFIYAMGNNL